MPSTLLFAFGLPVEGVTAGLADALPYITHLVSIGTTLSPAHIAARAGGQVAQKLAPLSANEILRRVTDLGFKFRRQAGLRVVSQLKAQTAAAQYIQNLAPSRRPLQSKLPLTTYRYDTKYAYFVNVHGTNEVTGEETNQMVTLKTSRLLSPNEARNQAMAIVEDEEFDYNILVDDAQVVQAVRSPLFFSV